MSLIPHKVGFYYDNGKPCRFADSEQIGKDKYRLQHNLHYRAVGGSLFVIKEGFIHDGASKGILKHFGKYTNAAILHDALYGINYKERGDADDLFLEAMAHSNVNWLRRYTYWSMVRAIGWAAYNAKTEESIAECKQFIEIWEVV